MGLVFLGCYDVFLMGLRCGVKGIITFRLAAKLFLFLFVDFLVLLLYKKGTKKVCEGYHDYTNWKSKRGLWKIHHCR